MFLNRILPGIIIVGAAVAVMIAFAGQGGPAGATVEPTGTVASTGTVAATGTVASTRTAVRTTTAVVTRTVSPTGTPSVGEGCTPGFWKTHTNAVKYPNGWGPTGFSPNQTVGSVFNVPFASLAGATLAEGLEFQGGDSVEEKSEILLRAAIAAVLNAAHPDIDYPDSVASIVADVNAALASGDEDEITDLASELDGQNNLGCPINGK